MKKFLQKNAVVAAGVLFTSLLISRANAGDLEDGNNSKVDMGIGSQKPRLRASVDIREGYDDNVFTTNTNRVGSAFTSASANIFADLGNERTVLTIGLGGGISYYYDRPGDKTDKSGNLTVNLVHKVNERLTLSVNSYTTYQVEPQFDLLVAQNRRSGQYFYTADTISASYDWTKRFSTVTSYNFIGIFYEDQASRVVNDYIQQTFANQFRFVMTPTTTVVAEYRFGVVNYLYQNERNTITNYVLGGFDHSFSPKLSMTLRAGGQIQTQDVGGTSSSPYVEITGNYAYQRFSNIQAYLNYGFQYSNLLLSQSNKALRTGIRINHGFSPKLSVFAGFFYEHDDYSTAGGLPGSSFSQDTLDISVGARYAMTPKLSFNASYAHTELLSDIAAQEYYRNLFTLGASYSF